MLRRRTFAHLAGIIGLAALAGCSGGDDSIGGNGTGDDGTEANGDSGEIEFREPESYVVETEADGTTIVAEIHGDDTRITYEGMAGETVVVDGVTYDVYADDCYIVPEDDPDAPDDSEFEMDAERLEREGTETIDGTELVVFTIDHPVEGEAKSYVDPETGYTHRMESELGTTEFHSFGEVDPIEPPSTTCQELPDGL